MIRVLFQEFGRGIRVIEEMFQVNTPNREESNRTRDNLTPQQISCIEKIVKTLLESSQQTSQEPNKTYILTFRAINRAGLEESITSCRETIGKFLKQIQHKHQEYKEQVQKKYLESQEDSKLTAFTTCQRVQRYIDDNWSKLTDLESLTAAKKEWEQLENKTLEFNPEKSGTLTDWKEYWRNSSVIVKGQIEQMIKTIEVLESPITVTITKIESGSSQIDKKLNSHQDDEADDRIKGSFIIEEETPEQSQNSPPRKKFAIQKKEISPHAQASTVKSSEDSTEDSTPSGMKPNKYSQTSLVRWDSTHYPDEVDSDQEEQKKLNELLKTIVEEALGEVNRTLAGDPNKTRDPYDAKRRNIYLY